ncbi:response regulator [Heliophilum fasciatum]|uniref:Stage 0 sporulation protein A homolog n=1 Tax=Heliophilum fasciatum TaxID=35700 RepID=A0A4R2SBV5_9FIRM|nr:response regulator transcription factor [Heliophilum fasciatum]MCW2276885.1 DNA-binding response OmpR family regulator [Heliophilum fasciatum]TCP68655.1 DNA-binding response OmpR family regulator [Heliophilum fasciatum]
MSKILIVEDEIKLRESIGQFLRSEGLAVIEAADGLTALKKVREEKPDLLLLDIMLPELTGIQICKIVRQEWSTPIIMLTALGSEDHVLDGLEQGADDYIVKPFRMRELVARIRAVLRRHHALPATGNVLAYGELNLDLDAVRLEKSGREIPLTPTEFKLLAMMARQPGRAFTRLQLLEGAIGETFENYERTVDTHIFNLRKKIEAHTGKPQYLQTVFGIGYRFGEKS